MSPAAWPENPPGQGPGPSGTAELLCALSYGSGLAVAERMEHGTNTAFAGIQLGRALGLGAEDLEAVFYGALIKDVGCGPCGAVLAPFFAARSWLPGSISSWLTCTARAAWGPGPGASCGWIPPCRRGWPGWPPSPHSAGRWRMRRWRPTARSPPTSPPASGSAITCKTPCTTSTSGTTAAARPFIRRADAIPRPAQVLHLALAADIARSLSGAGEAAAMVRQRAGSYFEPDVAEAYLDLAGGLVAAW